MQSNNIHPQHQLKENIKSVQGLALITRKALISLCAMLLLISIFLVSGCSCEKSDPAVEECTIESVRIDKRKNKVLIKIFLTEDYADANKGRTLYLFEIMPHQRSLSLNALEPIEIIKTKSKISTSVDFAVETRNRLFSSFVVAEKSAVGDFTPIANPKYIENPEVLASSAFDYPTQSSKKGLIYDNLADLQALGASHTVIDVDMSKLFRASGGQGTVPYLFNGVTFYLDREKLALLDYEIRVCTEAGVNVYLNILLGSPDVDTNDSLLSLYYNYDNDSAKYFAVNVDNELSITHFQGFMGFISERYTRDDREFGFAGSYILGYEVNDNRGSNYAGEMEPDIYIDAYLTLLRMADTAVRSNYAYGRVYVSLANNFASNNKNNDKEPNPTLDYSAKELLTTLAEKTNDTGNFPWNVAISPYASDRLDTEIWSDAKVENTFNTPFITMQNIHVFTDFLSQKPFLYDGEMRSLIISSFGISADPDDEDALRRQAAAYAFAYHTSEANDHIDAFVYSRQRDNSEDNLYYYGLFDQSGAVKKPICELFAAIDLESEEDPTNFALPIIGASSWQSIIKNYQDRKPARVIIQDGPVIAESRKYKRPNEVLYDFTKGSLFNFYPSDNAEYVELRSDEHYPSVMYAKLMNTGNYQMMGISRAYYPPINLKNVKCITLRIKIDVQESSDAETTAFTLVLKSEGTPDRIYEGKAQVACGKWVDLTFYIGDYLKKTSSSVDLIKLLVEGEEAGEHYGLWVESISAYRYSPFWMIVLITVVLLILAVAAFIFCKKRTRPSVRMRTTYIGSYAPTRGSRAKKMHPINHTRAQKTRYQIPHINKRGSVRSEQGKDTSINSVKRDIFSVNDDNTISNKKRDEKPK